MHCINLLELRDLLHLRHSRAGDTLSWRRRPLRLETDPEFVGGVWVARGTWEGYAVRVEQAVGDELLVYTQRTTLARRQLPRHTRGGAHERRAV
jgi:hypothetical protein